MSDAKPFVKVDTDAIAPPPQTGPIVRLAKIACRSSLRFWGVVDLFCVLGAFAILQAANVGSTGLAIPGAAIAITAATVLLVQYIFGAYDQIHLTSLSRILFVALATSALAFAVVYFSETLLGASALSTTPLLWAPVVAMACATLLRVGCREIARHYKVRMMFVGRRDSFAELLNELRHHHGAFYDPPIFADGETSSVTERADVVLRTFQHYQPDEVIVEDSDHAVFLILQNAAPLLYSGCILKPASVCAEERLLRIPVDTIDHRGVFGSGLNAGRKRIEFLKRVIDIVVASTGLLLALPLMAISALAIKATSPGPVFYRQNRVGRYGRVFSIYKFRTMRHDAEANGVVWAGQSDNRKTRVGQVLRRTRIDELPQLWNILKGDMSFVGPRPERPEFVEELREYIPHYDLRHLVPPGLTGWAQVHFRYGASVEDSKRKLSYDLFYVRRYGIVLDVAICLRTICAAAKGAR
jgi:exopolysaccharide biosynthesis polyprenyl glycosylphosphotransferase